MRLRIRRRIDLLPAAGSRYGAGGRLNFIEMRKLLPTRLIACVLLGLCGLIVEAQMHKVEKPERVTRAIAVYEFTGELSKPAQARLVPVSLFINDHFEDAGVYLAQPVPFVLQPGDVYSIERAGEVLGTLDVDSTRRVVTRRAVADDDPVGAWYAYGIFTAPMQPKPSKLKASVVKPVIAGGEAADDDQPHLAVRAGAQDTTTPAKPGEKSSDTAAKSAPGVQNPAPEDDPDRPTLRHRDAPPPGKAKKEKDSGSVIPMQGSLNDDPDRPVLRRGTVIEELVPKQLDGVPAGLHQVVAVSDAANRDPHSFKREWESEQERKQTLAAVQALARPMVAAYLAKNRLQAVVAADAASKASAGPSFASTPKSAATAGSTSSKAGVQRAGVKKATASPPAPSFSLTNEVLEGYLLSYGGLPTFVYTTEVPVAAGGPVYLTMVAQRLPMGELQVSLSSVTDATHMDRTPWMRPVDVVDADASHRASLLIELRAQSSRQFALYRLVTAKAEQTFVTGIIE